MGISPPLDAKLQDLELRKIEAEVALGDARRTPVIPNRSEVQGVWTQLVDGLGELPKKMTDTEVETARTAIKGILGEIRVTRDGQGYTDVCVQSMVAGAGLPSPLRGSVGLGVPIPMLRIGAPRLELLPRSFKPRSFPNEKGPH